LDHRLKWQSSEARAPQGIITLVSLQAINRNAGFAETREAADFPIRREGLAL